ncbi:hypothetical protein ACFLS9_07425, partial [Bacteroidota bacterium]
ISFMILFIAYFVTIIITNLDVQDVIITDSGKNFNKSKEYYINLLQERYQAQTYNFNNVSSLNIEYSDLLSINVVLDTTLIDYSVINNQYYLTLKIDSLRKKNIYAKLICDENEFGKLRNTTSGRHLVVANIYRIDDAQSIYTISSLFNENKLYFNQNELHLYGELLGSYEI